MAIAHVCEGCGHDLSRVRAAREPVYGLWVARCPSCTKVSPRSRVSDRSLRRKFARVYLALLRLELRLTGVGVCVLANAIASYALAEAYAYSYFIDRAEWTLFGASHLVGGAFVHLSWSHLHPVRRWLTLWGIVSVIAVLPVFGSVGQWVLAGLWPGSFSPAYWDTGGLVARLVLAPALTGGALLAGYPVALGLGLMHDVVRAARWRSQLSRARQRRFSA